MQIVNYAMIFLSAEIWPVPLMHDWQTCISLSLLVYDKTIIQILDAIQIQ